MARLSLYEIDARLRDFETALIEAGGEITPELEATYADLLEMRADKVEGYIAVIRQAEVTAAAIKEEEQRLGRLRKTQENIARRLKERLLVAMMERGETEHQTTLGKVKLQTAGKRPVALRVEPEDLPARFQRIKIDADKRALAEALEQMDDEAARVAFLADPSPSLRIY
ncbi:MAG: siphovirus Gp157 family protein [Bacteroidota bacterium]